MNIYQKRRQLGYSINEMVIIISILGILATFVLPNFIPALEYVELLLAEKSLLSSVKQCQLGLIRQDINPQYSFPEQNLSLGLMNNRKFIFSSTGDIGECFSAGSSNKLRVSRINTNTRTIYYSLTIDVVNGAKTSEGQIPEWLDWWKGSYVPLISDDDPLILEYEL